MGNNQHIKRMTTEVKFVVGQGVAKKEPYFSGNEGDGTGLAMISAKK